jgi:hypothetical protein
MLKTEKQKVAEHRESLKSIEEKIILLESNEAFELYNDALERKQHNETELKNAKFQLEQNEKTIAKFKAITSEASKIEEIKSQLSTAQKEYLDSKGLLNQTSFWRELLTPKSKTRMDIASTLLQTLNSTIQKYINNFYNKDVHMSFAIIDNNINENIVMNNEKFKYDQLSSGEKQKIDIIIVLALLDIAMTQFKNNKLKFLIVDESLDHLDMVWARYTTEFIKQYAVNLNMMILFISHHSVVEELDSVFDNKIVAYKDSHGNSTIQ